MAILEHEHNELLELWESRQNDYEENLDSQKYHRDAEQAETWITSQEAHLLNEDYGVRILNATVIPSSRCGIVLSGQSGCG